MFRLGSSVLIWPGWTTVPTAFAAPARKEAQDDFRCVLLSLTGRLHVQPVKQPPTSTDHSPPCLDWRRCPVFATRGFYGWEEQTLTDCGGEIKRLMSRCELDVFAAVGQSS